MDSKIKKMEALIATSVKELDVFAQELHVLREGHKKAMEQQILEIVTLLGMPDAQFIIQINGSNTF